MQHLQNVIIAGLTLTVSHLSNIQSRLNHHSHKISIQKLCHGKKDGDKERI